MSLNHHPRSARPLRAFVALTSLSATAALAACAAPTDGDEDVATDESALTSVVTDCPHGPFVVDKPVHLRSCASSTCVSKRVLMPGEAIARTGGAASIKGYWIEVSAAGSTGWVFAGWDANRTLVCAAGVDAGPAPDGGDGGALDGGPAPDGGDAGDGGALDGGPASDGGDGGAPDGGDAGDGGPAPDEHLAGSWRCVDQTASGAQYDVALTVSKTGATTWSHRADYRPKGSQAIELTDQWTIAKQGASSVRTYGGSQWTTAGWVGNTMTWRAANGDRQVITKLSATSWRDEWTWDGAVTDRHSCTLAP